MPVIRSKRHGKPENQIQKRLVAQLLGELRGHTSGQGPVIFETPTHRRNEIDVVVVWEAWSGVPVGTRAEIVHEAYRQRHQEVRRGLEAGGNQKLSAKLLPKVAMVTAATGADVVALDLLRYAVFPETPDAVDAEDLRCLMKQSGAVETPLGLQLRFPRRGMAEEVMAKLKAEMPEVGWKHFESEFGPVSD